MAASERTTRIEPVAGDAPTESAIGVFKPAGTTVAMPVHFTEPSGQYASGHVWAGSSAVPLRRLRVAAGVRAPCGQGTPKLTPAGSGDELDSSQCKATGSPCAKTEAAASPATVMSQRGRWGYTPELKATRSNCQNRARNARSVPLHKHSIRLDRMAISKVRLRHPVQPHPVAHVAEASEAFVLP